MTPDEQKRARAAANKRAYRLRKKQEEQARMQDSRRIAEATPNPLSKEQQAQAALRLAEANGIAVQPTPEAEEAWKRVQVGNLEPLSEQQLSEYVSNREKAEAAVSEAVARDEMVELLFKPYEKVTNIPQLLSAILRELITLRVNLTDLIGGLNK